MRTICILSLLLAAFAAGQGTTQVNYINQVQSGTKPVKTGTTLPASCKVGDLFLKLNAPVGANLYACITANAWTLQGNTTGTGGAETIAGGGVAIGTEPIDNFSSGNGIIQSFADTGTQIIITTAIDPAVVLTHSQAQSGGDLYCVSLGTVGQAYTCTIVPVLTNYVRGMVLEWTPDVATVGGPTSLSVDGLAAIPVKLEDGSTDPTEADILANRMLPLWFDGTSFRLFTAPGRAATGTTRPVCDVTLAGRIWYTPGGMGVKDQVAVCVKNAMDVFSWGVIY